MAASNVTLKVGSVYYELDLDDKKFKQKSKSVKDETKSLGAGFGQLGGAAKTLGLALGISIGLQTLVQGFKSAISAAAELERSMLGLSQVARAFGVESADASKAAQDLAKDGLMTVQESAEALKNLLATGFSLDEATQLMYAFKDASAANRQGTLGFGEAIVGATIGIKNQNSVLVDNVGISKNLSVILREQGLSVDALQDVTSDASVRQKLFNGLMKEAQIFNGAAADTADTLSGSLAQLETQTFNLSAAIGTALAPGVQFAISQFTGFTDATAGINENMLVIQSIVIGLVGSFIILGKAVIGVAKTIYNALTLNFEGARDSFYETIGGIQQTFEATQQKIVDNTIKSYGAQDEIVNKSAANQEKVMSEKERKIAKQLEDETYNFQKNLEKRDKAFAENLADMIFAHMDKVRDLKKNMADETQDFNENLSERNKKFKESMAEMLKDHEKKTADIKKQMAEETQDAQEAEAEKLADAKEKLDKEKKEYDKKRVDLETQIDKEVAKGKNASQTRLGILREELAQETADYEEKVLEINTKVDKEVAKSKAASQEKMDDLQSKLAEEELAYTESKAKAEQAELEQTAKLQKEHDTRIADYQTSLNEEQAILNRHQEEVNAVKDKAREDDITRLIRQHNEENEAAVVEHNRRMADIRTRGDQIGKTLGDSINAGLGTRTSALQGQISSLATEAGRTLDNNLKTSAKEAGRNMIQSLIDGIRDNIGRAYDYISQKFSDIGNYAKSKIPGFASGVTNFQGGLAVVGEKGPELVRLPPGTDVIPNSVAFPSAGAESSQKQSSPGGMAQDIKVFVDKISNMGDVEAIGREIGFRAALVPNMGAR